MNFNFVFTDRVTEVKTDIYVTSFGPVSDTDMVSLTPHLMVHHPQHITHTKCEMKMASVSLKASTAHFKRSKKC